MDLYDSFLQSKNNDTVWRKAKQKEFNSLDQIILTLDNLKVLTWRNAMTLRMLGLVDKPQPGSGLEVALTEASSQLLKLTNKQQILDEQLLKLYLDSHVNPSLSIPVYPTAIVYEILSSLGSLSFDEYAMFVCWISNDQDKITAQALINQHRSSNPSTQQLYQETLQRKTASLGYVDFNDNIYRLFNMFKLSSYIYTDTPSGRWSDTLKPNSQPSTYQTMINQVTSLNLGDYENILTTYQGLITTTPDYSDVILEMSELSANEQRIIKQQLVERNQLPDITAVKPQKINAKMLKIDTSTTNKTEKTDKAIKIDYEKRNRRNRLVGAYGERIVMKYEYDRLVNQGRSDLALKIEQVSVSDDSLGYDIKSFNADGTDRHIEVKTVSGQPKAFRFYISQNELNEAYQNPQYLIYIVLGYSTNTPKILEISDLKDSIETGKATLTPVNYTVTVNLEYF